MTSKSKSYCSVPQCNNYVSKNISMHRFPRDLNLQKKWQIAMKIGKPVSKCMVVCSEHFVPSDYSLNTPNPKIRHLKRNAIPTQNVPVSTHQHPVKIRKFRKNILFEDAPTEEMDTDKDIGIVTESVVTMGKTKKKGISQTNCCVYGCHSVRTKDRDTSFHNFPAINSCKVEIINNFGIKESVDRRKAWEKVLLLRKPATQHMRVCGKHFLREDFIFPSRIISKKLRLKKFAVPSQNLPKRTHDTKKVCTRNDRQIKLEQRQIKKHLQKKNIDPLENINAVDLCANIENIEEDGGLTLADLGDAVNVLLNNITKAMYDEKGVQVENGDLITSFFSTIKSDTQLNALSGLSNFTLLNDICELVEKLYPTARCRRLSIQDRVLLVFMKLKMAIKFNVLAIFFQIANNTCHEIFNEYVQYISNVLKPYIGWASIEECRANAPKCFLKYKKVRGIFDCMEIPVETAECRCCRIKTYSNYRSRQTLKFMICVKPGGLITFISSAYGGRTSDKVIFEQSDVINKLEPHIDQIMVDKGFLVDDICTRHFINIHRPFLLRKKKQFSSAEAKKNEDIAKARIHVERANQRIRIFEILNVALPWNMVPYIDDIFAITCAIVNLQAPILAENCF